MLKEVRAGMVMGNTTVATVPQVGVPFGGYKQSGLGREYGSDGIVSSFMETKTMFVKL
jgi:acyl-CoA reductase-like NAD-dependent aldehyde dehydrogenase